MNNSINLQPQMFAGMGPMGALARGRTPNPAHMLHGMVRMHPAVRSAFARGLLLGHMIGSAGQQRPNGMQQGAPAIPGIAQLS